MLSNNIVSKSSYPVCFSSELRNNIRLKNEKYKIPGSHSDYVLFSDLRKTRKNLSKCCYQNHLTHTENSLIVNPNYFWRYIENLKKKKAMICRPRCIIKAQHRLTRYGYG